ncbi:hypothetical protein F5884DRAFT_902511 [Xylogone sp. PMI_703]|nr:hypothetical protein F5884DRAFT_902511 [Xylogone sp. PMI_703]
MKVIGYLAIFSAMFLTGVFSAPTPIPVGIEERAPEADANIELIKRRPESLLLANAETSNESGYPTDA